MAKRRKTATPASTRSAAGSSVVASSSIRGAEHLERPRALGRRAGRRRSRTSCRRRVWWSQRRPPTREPIGLRDRPNGRSARLPRAARRRFARRVPWAFPILDRVAQHRYGTAYRNGIPKGSVLDMETARAGDDTSQRQEHGIIKDPGRARRGRLRQPRSSAAARPAPRTDVRSQPVAAGTGRVAPDRPWASCPRAGPSRSR